MNDDPCLVYSSHGADIDIDGYRFEVQIIRAEYGAEWLLEVIDEVGTSHVWDETFEDAKEAFDAALQTIEEGHVRQLGVKLGSLRLHDQAAFMLRIGSVSSTSICAKASTCM